MPEMCTRINCSEGVPEGGSWRYGTLSNVWYAVHVRRSSLMMPMPVHRRGLIRQTIFYIDYYFIAQTNLKENYPFVIINGILGIYIFFFLQKRRI